MISSLYLRVSITDRCNLRCQYCRPASGDSCADGDLLSADDFLRVVTETHRVVPVRKVRLTGGEPLLRHDAADIVRALRAALPQATLGLTTNGLLLESRATLLRKAGLDALNISLDSPEPGAFAQITRGGQLSLVHAGLRAAVDAGFDQLKVNTVLLASYNAARLADLVRLAVLHGAEPRFIELMPSGEGRALHRTEFLSAADALELLTREFTYEGPVGGSGTAKRHRFLDGDRLFVVGFISPVSMPFCDTCDRLRLDSRGVMWSCLRHGATSDLRDPLRRGDCDEVRRRISDLLASKRSPEQEWAIDRMAAIGG